MTGDGARIADAGGGIRLVGVCSRVAGNAGKEALSEGT